MATKIYPVDVEILLTPVGQPKCRVTLDNYCRELTVDTQNPRPRVDL